MFDIWICVDIVGYGVGSDIVTEKQNEEKKNQQSEINIDFSIMLIARIYCYLLQCIGKSYNSPVVQHQQ